MCYLNDFLGQSGLQPLEMFPVRDEQLKHVTGYLSHRFVPKLDKQTNKEDNNGSTMQWFIISVNNVDVKPARFCYTCTFLGQEKAFYFSMLWHFAHSLCKQNNNLLISSHTERRHHWINCYIRCSFFLVSLMMAFLLREVLSSSKIKTNNSVSFFSVYLHAINLVVAVNKAWK